MSILRRFTTLCAALALFAFHASTATADPPPWYPSHGPWVNMDAGYYSAVRLTRFLEVPAAAWGGWPKNDSLLVMGADNGGVSRSLDLGHRFEVVNGGRGFTDAPCGGYSADEVGLTGDAADLCTNAAKALDTVTVGPPSAVSQYINGTSDIRDIAAGPWPFAVPQALAALSLSPDNKPKVADAVVYMTSGQLWASPDAARQWFPLSPQCHAAQLLPGIKLVAVDQGRPGHVVVGANEHSFGHFVGDVSHCALVGAPSTPLEQTDCGSRQIAWTNDVGRQIQASMLATADYASSRNGPRELDLAGGGLPDHDPTNCNQWCAQAPTCATDKCPGCDVNACKANALALWKADAKWRYATVSHLATAKGGATCTIGRKLDGASWPGADPPSWLPDEGCGIEPEKYCHGKKGAGFITSATTMTSDQDDAFCPNLANCTCKSDPANCSYPDLQSLAIDPRNGFVYATATTGLLTSPTGGEHWVRRGKTAAGDDMALLSTTPAGPGGRLLSMQYPSAPLPAQPSEANAYDLNLTPEKIKNLGRISLSWKKCANGATYATNDYAGLPRVRGALTAVLAVDWVSPAGTLVSSVFMAHEPDDCDPAVAKVLPGALVFRDTANLLEEPGVAPKVLGKQGALGTGYRWVAREMPNEADRPIKLVRAFPIAGLITGAAPNTSVPAGPLFMHYTNAAVAPSDDRVLYAFGLPLNWPDAASPPAAAKSGTRYHVVGMWRSRDRGRSWAQVMSMTDPAFEATDYGGGNGPSTWRLTRSRRHRTV